MPAYNVLFGTGPGPLSWDPTNEYLGVATATPRYQLDIPDNGNYANRAILENTDLGSRAYANWGAFNGLGFAVFGIGGPNFDLFPHLKNRAYMYADAGTDGCVIYNLGNAPVRFVINEVVVGQWNVGGGLNIAPGTPTSHNNGDIWFDGTSFKAEIDGVVKTFVLA